MTYISFLRISSRNDSSSRLIGWSLSISTAEKTAWKDQGLPFYSWDVSYTAEYDIDGLKDGYVLKLGRWKGTVCEVFVNDRKAGIIAFQPYEMDITSFLNEGRNSVKVVCTGSLANLFGPHYSPRTGSMGPLSWDGVTERKGGLDYIFDGYGLYEAFEISEAVRPDTPSR